MMATKSTEVSWRRARVFEVLRLLADAGAQDDYDRQVAMAEVAVELVNQWFDDSFIKEEAWFREMFDCWEWGILSEFDQYFEERVGKLPKTYRELRVDPCWVEVMLKAKWVLDKLANRD